MQVLVKKVREPIELVADEANVVILSNDGQHAHVIIESELRVVRVYVAGEPEFVEKAKSYGFDVPKITKL